MFWQIFILFWFVQLHWMLFQTIELLLKPSSKFLSVVEALWGICLGHLCQIFILDFWTTCRNSSDKMFSFSTWVPSWFFGQLVGTLPTECQLPQVTALTMFLGNLTELLLWNVYFLKELPSWFFGLSVGTLPTKCPFSQGNCSPKSIRKGSQRAPIGHTLFVSVLTNVHSFLIWTIELSAFSNYWATSKIK